MLKYPMSPEKEILREAKESEESWKDFIKRKNAVQKQFQKSVSKL